jgi:F0F1-type ATP synthase membrane subunit b/b'
MPQLDFSIYLPQIFWFSIVFGSFFLLCSLAILPRLKNIASTRESFFKKNLDLAKKNNEKIKNLEIQIQNITNETNKEIQQIMSSAISNSKILSENIIKQTEELNRNSLKQAEEKFNHQANDLLKELHTLKQTLSKDLIKKMESL